MRPVVRGVTLITATLLLLGLTTGVMATPNGVHAEKFSCTECHTRRPGPNDTIADAPLVMPVQELCAKCHESENQ